MPMTVEQATDMLTAAYKAEVEYRHGLFRPRVELSDNIWLLAEMLCSDNNRFGILLSGTCGNGKTTMLYALQHLVNWLSSRGYLPMSAGIKVVDAKEVATYSNDWRKLDALKLHEMLAIEDLGREPMEVMQWGNYMNPVVDLLEWRYNEQLFTIITTNLTPKEIREKYGNRIADRFNEMFEKIIFSEPSYRGLGEKKESN